MHQKTPRWAILLTALLITVAFAACGGGSSKSIGDSTAGDSQGVGGDGVDGTNASDTGSDSTTAKDSNVEQDSAVSDASQEDGNTVGDTSGEDGTVGDDTSLGDDLSDASDPGDLLDDSTASDLVTLDLQLDDVIELDVSLGKDIIQVKDIIQIKDIALVEDTADDLDDVTLIADVVKLDFSFNPDLIVKIDAIVSINPSSCNDTSACETHNVYYKNVKSEADCYCPGCPSNEVTLNKTFHQIYKTNWETYCTDWAKNQPCGVVKCIAPLPVECSDAKLCQVVPNGCNDTFECAQTVSFTKLVTSKAECYCPGCDKEQVHLNNATLEKYKASWELYCKDTICPAVLCVQNYGRVCEGDNTCQSVRSCSDTKPCQSFVIYTKPVYAPADCYCPGCPTNTVFLNQKTHNLYKSMWTDTCTQWALDHGCKAPEVCKLLQAVTCQQDGLCSL